MSPALQSPVKLYSRARIALMAAAVAAIALCIYFFQFDNHSQNQNASYTSAAFKDVDPGKQSATLTLANGKKIKLTAAVTGKLANESGISITKSADGQLNYVVNNEAAGQSGLAGTNTLSTANGETYLVTLPDQTKIWLNAASSITYPLSLGKLDRREVKLTGEAYFEVAKDKARPFKVISGNQVITVLGTHFNVKCYHDEPEIKTTLLEGKVQVTALKGKPILLSPGQQSLLTTQGLRVVKIDSDQEVAWKNGDFLFNGQNIEEVMRTISRWYDVDVAFNVKPGEIHVEGEVSRSRKLSAILAVLESTSGLKFSFQGNTITVSK